MKKQIAALKKSAIREFHDQIHGDVIDLTIGDPYYTSEVLLTNIKKAAVGRQSYAPVKGNEELRNEIMRVEKRNNIEEILICNGATQGLQLVFSSCLNAQDEVILPFPCYPQYVDLCQLHDCQIKELDLDENAQIEESKLAALINENTKAILLNTPHNPTGKIYSLKSLRILRKCLKNKNILVIWDAVYDFCLDEEIKEEIRKLEQLIEIHSFSKSFGVCGWRIGYIVSSKPIIDLLARIHQCSEVCSSSLIQKAMINYSDISMQEEYDACERNRNYVMDRCQAMGLSCQKDSGVFYVFPSIHQTHLSSEAFARILLEQFQVAVLPGKYFYQENHIRISCCVREEELIEGMNRMKAMMELI